MKKLPRELRKLIDCKQWPLNGEQFSSQSEVFSKDTVKKIFPEEEQLFFSTLPFMTVAQLLKTSEKRYWQSPPVKIEEIEPENTLVIADFGMGADTALAFDYRFEEPKVIKLIYNKGWVTVAENFRELSEKLELRKIIWA